MKAILHKAEDRGAANHGWLNAKHSFSFASYHDPEKMHFGLLRVLNDDIVAPGMGFGTHPHDNMEIVTIPLSGTLAHKDSMGNASVITPGEIQIMSAGTGVTHSEFNNSKTEEVRLLQIWVYPKQKNIEPRYDQKKFSVEDRKNKLITVVSPDKSDVSMWINQDAYFSIGTFDKDFKGEYKINKKGNGVYLFVIDGEVTVADYSINIRDALGISETDSINFSVNAKADLLFIEVPMDF